ncbi:DUF397 domain-containing protein [Actinacidiphila oryziradicis]|jgi:hypothetical protein|uniref:DUF397 domain-containing protein n=1 Tax=Actinacidiphila oryziradicis TaxID=2571141 RepID=A0A4U0S324_9ACTN|nr:DUF397 domain-containing protein [Actinacidiphila oryziradicis]TKA03310.1 DUF397 domain-containing protein [Actinacidiphila oryziradicis]
MPHLDWQKSTFSGDQANCIELAASTTGIHIRESDDPEVIITTAPAELAALIAAIRNGQFDG